ncbi:MAG: lipoprotein insertase outer membrane protein LolB [Gammaproteobacteria bacterium]
MPQSTTALNRILSWSYARWVTSLGVAVILAGCASTPPPLPLEEQKNYLQTADTWTARGRFGAQLPDKYYKGFARLDSTASGFKLKLSGPLGLGGQTISGLWRDTQVTTGSGRKKRSIHWHEIGLPLPHPAALRTWLLGFAPQNSQSVTLDFMGRNRSFVYQGWQVEYLQYRLTKGIWLPTRIRLKQEQQSTLLVIKHWKLR